jgi:hypothetical protein
MTVLVAASSPEGFAIAADGRRISANGDYFSENAQKIWHAVRPGEFALAYGWCGNTRLESGLGTFDFPTVSQEVLGEISEAVNGAQPETVFREFARKVYLRLKYFLEGIDPSLSTVKVPETIAQVLFVGYVGQNPMQVIGTFSHRDGQAQVPCLSSYDSAENDFLLLSGSATLFERFEGPEITTLRVAIETVRKYAQDCVDQRCTIADCSAFGGHIHVGSVTTEGFSWVVLPIGG